MKTISEPEEIEHMSNGSNNVIELRNLTDHEIEHISGGLNITDVPRKMLETVGFLGEVIWGAVTYYPQPRCPK